MYKIGDFAKIVDIPVRTLRFYDTYGVLQPSEIDDFTGYRYYSDENIVECELGENGINSIYVICYSFDINWGITMNLEHDILVWTFEIVDMKYECYCIEDVL